jgi:hypothetical protein
MPRNSRIIGLSTVLLLTALLLLPVISQAHCDTLAGPVVQTARAALAKGDVTPLLKWVRAENENEIRQVFQQTLVVRAKGPEARELADRYFFETLVRIHRAGEGAPYTGLKSGAAVDPAVALADQALESGAVDKLVAELTGALAHGVRERFAKARETGKHAEESVAAGREFVEAYVVFTHYVEGVHGLIKGGVAHHGADEGKAVASAHEHE